ncbi:MAG: hypothetical protein ABI411_11205 [Tahibacter sp.]
MKSVIFLLLTTPLAASAADVLTYQSQTGDYIGQGQTQALTYTPGTITGQIYGNGIRLSSPNGASPNWGITLTPRKSGTMKVGCFERSLRMNYDHQQQPQLDMSMASRGCNESIGRYKILELVRDPGTQAPLKVAVDFVQNCSANGGPALFGKLRMNSDVSVDGPFLDPSYTASGQLTYTAATGAIGASGGPTTRTIPFTQLILTGSRNYDNGASVRFTGPVTGVGSSVTWSLDFAGPDDVALANGTYLGATRFPFQAAGHPGLDFSFNGSGCNTSEGQFTVTGVSSDALSNAPLSLHTSFQQRCPTAAGPLTSGTLDFDASFLNAPADPDVVFINDFSGAYVPTSWDCP